MGSAEVAGDASHLARGVPPELPDRPVIGRPAVFPTIESEHELVVSRSVDP
jgi:hypothetical protein